MSGGTAHEAAGPPQSPAVKRSLPRSRRRSLRRRARVSPRSPGRRVPSAHGLIQRANLPIPEWLFGWAAAIVLIVSFVALAVLWPQPAAGGARRLAPAARRHRARSSRSRAVEIAAGAIGVGFLALTSASGLSGAQEALANFAPTFVFIIFWVGLVFASVLFGDVFRALNPWRAIGRVLFRGRRARPYPERLGRWPAAAGLLAFTWLELASQGWSQQPRPAGRPQCSATRSCSSPAMARLRRRGLDRARRGLRRLLRALRAHLAV